MTCKKLCEAWPTCECAVAARGWRDPNYLPGADGLHVWHAYRWDPDRKVGTTLCGQWDLDECDHAPFDAPPEGALVCEQCAMLAATAHWDGGTAR